MQNPGPIAQRAAAQALANIGVQERGGENRGKFVEVYQQSAGISPGDPWCAAFIYYRLKSASDQLGKRLPDGFPREGANKGYTPDYKNWALKNGLHIPASKAARDPKLVQVGDLALFYFPRKGRIAHIGIVVDKFADGMGVVTVEGNTGPDAGDEVNRDGDGVFKKRRKYTQLGSAGGFVRLPW